MKHSLLYIIPLLVLSACEPIDKDERLLYVEPAPIERAVLIEDFTGQGCVNCPYGALTIDSLQEELGTENVIAVAIHCPPDGFAGRAKNIGLMNDKSTAYGQHWEIEKHGQPQGLINRNGELKTYKDWKTAVYDAMQQTSPVQIDLAAKYVERTLSADIDVQVTAYEDVSAKLQLWLVQDSIVAMQKLPDALKPTAGALQGDYDTKYVHNHVFRTWVNGQWGEDISIAGGMDYRKSDSVNLDNRNLSKLEPPYVPEHCSIVAFVYNEKGVLQVKRAKLSIE